MLQFPIPASRSGLTMQRCMEAAVENMKKDLDAHQEGNRIYPEDMEGCGERVNKLWDEIKELRNLASFALSNATELGEEYELTSSDPLMRVCHNAVLLEFIDQELGNDTRSSIGSIMNYLLVNPIMSYLPDNGPRVYH